MPHPAPPAPAHTANNAITTTSIQPNSIHHLYYKLGDVFLLVLRHQHSALKQHLCAVNVSEGKGKDKGQVLQDRRYEQILCDVVGGILAQMPHEEHQQNHQDPKHHQNDQHVITQKLLTLYSAYLNFPTILTTACQLHSLDYEHAYLQQLLQELMIRLEEIPLWALAYECQYAKGAESTERGERVDIVEGLKAGIEGSMKRSTKDQMHNYYFVRVLGLLGGGAAKGVLASKRGIGVVEVRGVVGQALGFFRQKENGKEREGILGIYENEGNEGNKKESVGKNQRREDEEEEKREEKRIKQRGSSVRRGQTKEAMREQHRLQSNQHPTTDQLPEQAKSPQKQPCPVLAPPPLTPSRRNTLFHSRLAMLTLISKHYVLPQNPTLRINLVRTLCHAMKQYMRGVMRRVVLRARMCNRRYGGEGEGDEWKWGGKGSKGDLQGMMGGREGERGAGTGGNGSSGSEGMEDRGEFKQMYRVTYPSKLQSFFDLQSLQHQHTATLLADLPAPALKPPSKPSQPCLPTLPQHIYKYLLQDTNSLTISTNNQNTTSMKIHEQYGPITQRIKITGWMVGEVVREGLVGEMGMGRYWGGGM